MTRAFTLFEIVLVVLIIGVFYFFVFVNLKNFVFKPKLSYSNLKSYLYDQEYKQSVKLVCLDDPHKCLVYIDDELDHEIANPLSDIWNVYQYSQEYQKIVFPTVSYDGRFVRPSFVLEMNRDRKHNNFLLESSSHLFVFHSIYLEVQKLESYNEFRNQKQQSIARIRDAI